MACGEFQTLLVLVILLSGQKRAWTADLVGVKAAIWLESMSECKCVWCTSIEEAPDDGKWVHWYCLLVMFCQ